jgi:hypothetical protein
VKLSRSQGQIVFVTLMALIMSGAMSLALGIVYSGFAAAIHVWPSRWFVAFCVAWPIAFFVIPLVRRIVDALT